VRLEELYKKMKMYGREIVWGGVDWIDLVQDRDQ
jgi:hypothetical protein